MDALKIIQKYGLKPGFKRKTTFLIYTSAPVGYTIYLRRNYGLSYQAVGVLKEDDSMLTLVNADSIAHDMGLFLQSKKDRIESVLKEGEQAVSLYKEKIKNIQEKATKNPKEALAMILEFMLSQYWGGIFGIFNCLYRYMGEQRKKEFSDQIIHKIADLRNRLAEFYHEVDKIFISCTNAVGEQEEFEGRLLQNCTPFELQEYLKKGKLDVALKKKLSEREHYCLYFFIEDDEREIVITDTRIIGDVMGHVGQHEVSQQQELHGSCAYPGKVQGVVFNAFTSARKIQKGEIFVIHMTTPQDLPQLDKCTAIITDEGGILSHAAILARELKKPCVIGTRIATKMLHDGDLVEVDAEKGIVKKISPKAL